MAAVGHIHHTHQADMIPQEGAAMAHHIHMAAGHTLAHDWRPNMTAVAGVAVAVEGPGIRAAGYSLRREDTPGAELRKV